MAEEKNHIYDLVIIGASAAGISAAIYAARRKLDFMIVTYDIGGEVLTSGEIENYPGIAKTDGIELTEKFKEQLKIYDVKVDELWQVKSVEKDGELFKITAELNKESRVYLAKTAILATGVHPRELGVPGEKEYRGRGVTYCTTCDGPLFKGKTTVTIGGGNSALESALMMEHISEKVYVVNINPQFKGEQVLIDKVASSDKIEVIYSAETLEILGDGKFATGVKYRDKESSEKRQIDVQGVMIHIGLVPNSDLAEVDKNEFGEIVVNERCETNVPGLFAAGDVTNAPYKQIAMATGQGVCAALTAVDFLNKLAAQ
jgi:NADH-dependent peroxiredoxin subunit F